MIRCGIDIVYIPSLVNRLKDEAVLKKFFHANEVKNGSIEHLAGVVAAKEAFFKALGVIPKFLEVQIGYEPSGRPLIIAAPQWQKHIINSDVSISHDKNYATAVVLLEQ